MAAPLVAGIVVGCGLYYVGRLAPRVAKRASAVSGVANTHAIRHARPYHQYEYGFQSSMTEREAYLLLGFKENQAEAVFRRPSPEEVKKRYRTMMKDFHSDVSGTPYIATKLNEAKDILLK
jgi:DnaJ homolog subfamily C member 19